ncbi:MAG TPA: hypothetical protein PLV21_03085 [Cyclobacteriaceae bacterium]|nr:hypothetical protein [Cyclobacteriaceae bacterium]HRJ80841.1 hypothetical protein [Cyclobacteriaceae bacterium]
MRSVLVFLFCFELLVSWGASAITAGHPSSAIPSSHLSEDLHATDLIHHIICEETSSEERVEKTSHASVIVFEVFSELSKFESVKITWRIPHKLFDSSPPKYSLHQVFLI